MRFVRWRALLLGWGVLGGGAGVALADCPVDEPTSISRSAADSTAAPADCAGASKEEARSLADQASREGAHQRAAECYLQAGDHVQADRAYTKAAHQVAADTSQKISAAADDARLQARRIRRAFR
jgi:hypothetical protein